VERHETYMRRALDLAERGWGTVSPNPMVGALVVNEDQAVGEGWFEGPPGRPHAEVRALAAAGSRARGSTLYCTLEPCDHHGATPPCTQAVIAAGVARVVVGARDPNPLVDGRGLGSLRGAGIEVIAGILEDEARRLNAAFERHVTTGRPFVVLKSATSIDGKTAAVDGSSKWITSEAARADGQRLRAWADAIVVGANTVTIDEPALTVRDPRWAAARPPLRVVVDGRGGVPASGALFDASTPTLVATTDAAPRSRLAEWETAGAETVILDRATSGGVSLDALLDELGKRDVQGVLVEGGATLAWSFVRDGLVDRVVLYLAPKLVGGATAPGVLNGEGFAPIARALPLRFTSVRAVGPDLKVEADVQRDHRRAR
jgi:diaminohydroxyphosphoribosylaminopyrimidine deaminase/5-amino-6-(5-phosphoribosylamino)uracil reductase